jgi:hypothetical protein
LNIEINEFQVKRSGCRRKNINRKTECCELKVCIPTAKKKKKKKCREMGKQISYLDETLGDVNFTFRKW